MARTYDNVDLIPQDELKRIGELTDQLKNLKSEMVAAIPEARKLFEEFSKGAKNYKSLIEAIEKYRQAEEKEEEQQEKRRKVLSDLEKAEARLAKVKGPQAADIAKVNEQIRQQNQLNRQSAREYLANANTIELQRARVAKLKAEWANADIGSKKFNELEKDVKRANDELAKMEGKAGVWGRASWNLPIVDQLKSFATRLLSVGALLRAGFGLIRTSINLAREFEQANANLASILGKSSSEIEELTQSALRLGRQTQYTASQVTELQTELAKLGFTEQEIKNSQAAILDFALATGANLADAASLAGATLRAFQLDTRETERVVSVLAVSTNKSALSFGYLDSAMSTVAPVANAFNFSIEDTTALLGVLANAGFDASSAATATRNIFLNLADANGKLAKSLGQPITDINSLVEGLKRLEDRGIDLAEALDLTDKRSVAAFATFLSGADDVKVLRDELEDVSGLLQEIAERRTNTTEGAIGRLKSAWEGLSLSINDSNGALMVWIEGFAGVINRIADRINPELAAQNRATEVYEETLKDREKALNNWVKAYVGMGLTLEEAQEKAIIDFQEASKKQEEVLKNNLSSATDYFDELSKKWRVSKKDWENARGNVESAENALNGFIKASKDAVTNYVELQQAINTETTTPKASDGLTDNQRKRLQRERLKQAQNESKALQQIEQLTLKMRLDTQKIIISNDKKSYAERENALNQYIEIQKQLLERSAEDQKANLIQSLLDAENNGINTEAQARKAAEFQLLAIDRTAQAERIKIRQEGAKTRISIAEAEAKRIAQIVQNELSGTLSRLDLEELQKLQELSSGIYPTDKSAMAKYQADQEALIREYAQKRFEAEQDSLFRILELNDLSAQEQEAILAKMGENIVAFAKETADARIKDEETYAQASLRIEEQLQERKKQLLSDFQSFALSSISAVYDVQLKSLDKTIKKEEKGYDERRDQVERFEESGVISKEEAEARKKAIDDEQEEREAEVQRKRKELENQQFVIEQAFAIATITREMASAIFQIRAQAAILAANPVTAALSARALAQIPLVRASAFEQIGEIAAQSVSRFAHGTGPGGTKEDGPAIVGDGGRPEMVIFPTGEIFKTPSTDTLMSMPKGTIVKPDWNMAVQAMFAETKAKMMAAEAPQVVNNINLKQDKMETLSRKTFQAVDVGNHLTAKLIRTTKRSNKLKRNQIS